MVELMKKCPYCEKEFDLLKAKEKYCIECKKCGKVECQVAPYTTKEFGVKDEKGAFVQCAGCNENIYEQYSVYQCPHCKKEIKTKLSILHNWLIIK